MSDPSNPTPPIDTSAQRVDGIDLPPLPELPETPYLLAKDSLPYESRYISERGWEDDAVREYATTYAAAAVAAERERCAIKAWNHYMDTCKRMRVPAASFEHWCSAAAIRGSKT